MFKGIFWGVGFAFLLGVLLLTPNGAVYAQDSVLAEDGEMVADQPAATEALTAAEMIFDVDEAREAAVDVKSVVQESGKEVPDASSGGVAEDVKLMLYLPLVTHNANSAQAEVNAAEVTASWRTIKSETFEGSFPNSSWRVSDCNGSSYGTFYWDEDDYKPYSGTYSAWAANGGSNGLDPLRYYYPNNACALMVYGPFSLSSAQTARMTFRYWNRSELNFDYFGWYVSCDGVNFTGYRASGDSAGWRSQTLNLDGCLRDSSVWVAFRFTSDSTIVSDGPFVDNVKVQEYR